MGLLERFRRKKSETTVRISPGGTRKYLTDLLDCTGWKREVYDTDRNYYQFMSPRSGHRITISGFPDGQLPDSLFYTYYSQIVEDNTSNQHQTKSRREEH